MIQSCDSCDCFKAVDREKRLLSNPCDKTKRLQAIHASRLGFSWVRQSRRTPDYLTTDNPLVSRDFTAMAAFLIVALYFVCFTESRVLPDAERVRRETAPSIPQVNTTERLKELRALMQNQFIRAYIVPSVDAHMSEYVAPHFQRRQYISGFTGSLGDAVVTMNKSAMWTDGRYFLQATMQMDDNWTLMKLGQPGTLTRAEWLGKVLASGDKVGIDPNLVSITDYKEMEQELSKYGIVLTPVGMNLIDEIWEDRPPLSNKEIYPLGLEFTGEKWQDKVKRLRDAMSAKKASVIVLYSLDEVAWILNLRGADVPSNPFFFAFVVITDNAVKVYVSNSNVTDAVRSHLSVGKCSDMCAELHEYNIGDMVRDIQALVSGNSEIIWLNPYASYGLTSGISDDNLLIEDQPVALWKSVKNPIEIQGMKNANLKDNTAMMQFMHWLKNEVAKGSEDLTEMSASDKLEEFKSEQKDYMGYSFDTIAGFGPNGAIIHYTATNATNLRVTDKGMFLVDSGTQFKDGTTDTTRTFHFGEPTAKEKDAYTRVLKGHIDLALTVFPNNTQGRFLDPIARRGLWGNGLDYRHGTGHGIGMFLSVHEGPQRIAGGCPKPWEKPIVPGMFQSDEPGYYEDGVFGIRLETVVLAVPANTMFTFNDVQYVTFETVSFVPYEKKLIDLSLMTKTELDWLNDYHKQCRDKVGPLLMSPGDEGAYDYLMELTEPVGVESTKATASSLTVSRVTLLLTVAMFVAMQ